MATSSERQVTNTNYEFFILALSVLSIFNLVMELLPIVDPYVKNLLLIIDVALTPIFLADFLYRLFSAPSKWSYLTRGGGWLDFIGSLPFPGLRLARLFRMWRVYRALRRIGMRNIWRAYRQSRAESALLTVVFLAIVVIEFAGIFILNTERHDPTANIKTASDALWWAYVTASTNSPCHRSQEMACWFASFSVGTPVVLCSLSQRISSPCLFVTQRIY